MFVTSFVDYSLAMGSFTIKPIYVKILSPLRNQKKFFCISYAIHKVRCMIKIKQKTMNLFAIVGQFHQLLCPMWQLDTFLDGTILQNCAEAYKPT